MSATLTIGVPRESRAGETRLATSPEAIKKLVKRGYRVVVESGAGLAAGFSDDDFKKEGATSGDRAAALGADVVFKIHKPTTEEIGALKKGALLACFAEPYLKDGTVEKIAQAQVNLLAMELIPRTSRAQSMDALSSQAGIAGYRAVLEASAQYGRFFPLMMTSAGSSKAAKVLVLGAGVAGLQAIATARKLGANVEAYDVRPEVKEQILSLGAKFVELEVGEQGSGTGGYAKELSEEGKAKQRKLLTERIQKADVVISTANVPGRKAPTLITEEAVRGMRTGSVIVDMAAPSGGNCELTEAGKTVKKHGVTLVGITNFAGLVPADASNYYGQNLVALLALTAEGPSKSAAVHLNMDDDILAAALMTQGGQVRSQGGAS